MKGGTKDRFKKLASNKLISTLSILLLSAILSALMAFLYVSKKETADKGYISRAGEMQVLAQQIATYALSASRGSEKAFKQLSEKRDRFIVLMNELDGNTKLLPKSPKEVRNEFDLVAENWNSLRIFADEILKGKQSIQQVDKSVKAITEGMRALEKQVKSTIGIMVKKKADHKQIYFASRQLQLAQRIENDVSKVFGGSGDVEQAIKDFKEHSVLFGKVLEAMLSKGGKVLEREVTRRGKTRTVKESIQQVDPAAQQKLRSVAMSFTTVEHNAKQIIDTSEALIKALSAAGQVTGASDNLDSSISALLTGYKGSPGRLSIGVGSKSLKLGFTTISILGGLAVMLLVVLGFQLLVDAKRRESYSKEMNERNQQAILRLLDEMEYLADGDLTVQATVTEDVTGAIADAINNAIETLRVLVTTINKTSDQVTSSAQETRSTASELTQATEQQTVQIENVGESISSIARSIEQVSNDSVESEEVAQKSMDAATRGAAKVRSTIHGMDNIREQIQETSKRIKRLGESSQEIGDIVELIDDISDQTNILALNAAMQAAMAGEAGRGFAVVADEVQRLAERTGSATKQIEALVKTIQADTNEAVRSMETSTSGVVEGAKLAEEAGEALSEIETVSSQIADLIKRISDATQQQSGAAVKVSDTMAVIQDLTKTTSDGTLHTADSIGNLADLADDLQKSVAGFRLPESA
ncbi:MAG: chemotaxis protein [Methylococcales bacterium]|jgi:twitching motility protein PilJ|nr:chemotaxis protein [Methylococcales bacterium]MBT7444617.1 chemotaxis protein [Methylococcales bacterium]